MVVSDSFFYIHSELYLKLAAKLFLLLSGLKSIQYNPTPLFYFFSKGYVYYFIQRGFALV